MARGVIYIRDLTPCTAYTILIKEGMGEEVWRGRGETPGLHQVTGSIQKGSITNANL